MNEWRPCPQCGVTRGLDCDVCEGAGGIRPTVATDALLDRFPLDVQEEFLGVLKAVVKQPDELIGFLVEWEVLSTTGWSLEHQPRDPTLASWEKGYIAPGSRVPVRGHHGTFGPLYAKGQQ